MSMDNRPERISFRLDFGELKIKIFWTWTHVGKSVYI